VAPLARYGRSGVVLLAAGLAACGDPLTGTDYEGKPLLSFEGEVRNFKMGAPSALRVGLFWSPEGRTDAPPDKLIEDPTVSVAVTFPSTFRIDVFREPEDAWMVAGGNYGVASILVYDRPLGGRFDPGRSTVRGGALDHGVIYAAKALDAASSPTHKPVLAGMYVLKLPQPCSKPKPIGGSVCGVPIGAPCESDSTCGLGGACIHEIDDVAYPGGYCMLPWTGEGCETGESGWVYSYRTDSWYYAKLCTDDDDCRTDEGYACDIISQACLPDVPLQIGISSDYTPMPLCHYEN
jgi:hypothetical protein